MEQPEVTPREIEIVKMLAEGYSSREISFQLFISEHTVHTHRRNIVKKLGVRNVAHLVHYSWQNGLFQMNMTALKVFG
jgi:DNA-binding CsgD family transcriptional regulator